MGRIRTRRTSRNSLGDGAALDRAMMSRALELAAEARNLGEVPVGALVVRSGRIIAQAYNLRETLHDPTAHAERLALTWAGRALGSWRLDGCVLYVTLEPCAMCRRGDRPEPDRPAGLRRHRPESRCLREFVSTGVRPPAQPPARDHRRASWRPIAAKSSRNSSRNAGGFVNWTRSIGRLLGVGARCAMIRAGRPAIGRGA